MVSKFLMCFYFVKRNFESEMNEAQERLESLIQQSVWCENS